MKILYHGIILILILSGSFLFENQAYALWIPLSPQELLEKSMTIFVGNVSAVAPVDVQYQSQWARNGTMKQGVGPETMTLDEYTVHVEEFLKNPQDYDTIKLRQATVSGVPTGPSTIGGFKVGDRVLFYLPKYENQTHFPMQYLPESFTLPTFCNGKDVLTQERPEGGSEFTVIQNGVKVDYGNFTANEPIQFLSSKDMGTLSGKSYDLEVGITRNADGNVETVFSKEIHSSSKQCEWIASAEWEFTPQQGDYRMGVITKEGGIVTGTSDTGFSVKPDADTKYLSPLKQFKSGISTKDVKCVADLQLITRAEDNSPACVKQDVAEHLVERGWAQFGLWHTTCGSAYPSGNGLCNLGAYPVESPQSFIMTTVYDPNKSITLHEHIFKGWFASSDKVKFAFNSTDPIDFDLYVYNQTQVTTPLSNYQISGKFTITELKNSTGYEGELKVPSSGQYFFNFSVDKPSQASVVFTYSKVE